MKTKRAILLGVGLIVPVAVLCAGEKGNKGDACFSLSAPAGAAAASVAGSALSPASAQASAMVAMVGSVESGIGERLKAARTLGAHLGGGEIAALYSFLSAPPTEQNLPGLHALKNEVLNGLRTQAKAPAGLTGLLIRIYRDGAQDEVTRDYAIQHLISWCEQGAGDAADAKERIRAVLEQAAQEKGSIAGTALLGMHRLSQAGSAFNESDIKSMALKMAMDVETKAAARLSAMQVCAERGWKEALPAMESAARERGEIPLRLSAIAALGRLGGREQAALLERVDAGGNEVLRAAVRAALGRLQEKEKLF